MSGPRHSGRKPTRAHVCACRGPSPNVPYMLLAAATRRWSCCALQVSTALIGAQGPRQALFALLAPGNIPCRLGCQDPWPVAAPGPISWHWAPTTLGCVFVTRKHTGVLGSLFQTVVRAPIGILGPFSNMCIVSCTVVCHECIQAIVSSPIVLTMWLGV